MDSKGRVGLMEGKFRVSLIAGREIGERDFLLFEWNVGDAVRDGAQEVAAKSVRGKIRASFNGNAERVRMIFNGDGSDGAGFFAKGVKGRLSTPEDIHDSVNSLLEWADPAGSDLGAVVVVTKENCSGDKIP